MPSTGSARLSLPRLAATILCSDGELQRDRSWQRCSLHWRSDGSRSLLSFPCPSPSRSPAPLLQHFFQFFKSLVGQSVVVELKNDLKLHGTLHSVDQYLNIKLTNLTVEDAAEHPHLVRSATTSDGQAAIARGENAPIHG